MDDLHRHDDRRRRRGSRRRGASRSRGACRGGTRGSSPGRRRGEDPPRTGGRGRSRSTPRRSRKGRGGTAGAPPSPPRARRTCRRPGARRSRGSPSPSTGRETSSRPPRGGGRGRRASPAAGASLGDRPTRPRGAARGSRGRRERFARLAHQEEVGVLERSGRGNGRRHRAFARDEPCLHTAGVPHRPPPRSGPAAGVPARRRTSSASQTAPAACATSSSGVPNARSRPCRTTAISVATDSTSDTMCVERRTSFSPSCSERRFRKRTLSSGSRPAVGSSTMTSSGVADERLGDAEPLAHAAREALDRPLREVVKADAFQHREDGASAPDSLQTRDRVEELEAGEPRRHAEVLRQVAEPLADRARVLRDVDPREAQRPGRRARERREHLHERRLPRPVRPEEAEDPLARPQRQLAYAPRPASIDFPQAVALREPCREDTEKTARSSECEKGPTVRPSPRRRGVRGVANSTPESQRRRRTTADISPAQNRVSTA